MKEESGFPDYRDSIQIQSLIVLHPRLLQPEILAKLTAFHRAVDRLTLDDLEHDDAEQQQQQQLNFTVSSLLSLWNYDATAIEATSGQDVASAIRAHSSVTSRLLGGVENDGDSSRLNSSWPEGVNATIIRWIFDVSSLDGPSADSLKTNLDAAYESAIADAGRHLVDSDPQFRVYVQSHGAFTRARESGVSEDMYLLGFAYGAVFVFVVINLGAFTRLRHKFWLSTAGILCVGLAWVLGGGLASALGMAWGPIHPIIAFLLLGIGIDDMFVIVQAFHNCDEQSDVYNSRCKDKIQSVAKKVFTRSVVADGPSTESSIAWRVASSMRQVGVSITVTTATDVLAFGFGAISKLPAIRSFSVWLTLGMFSVYLLQVSGGVVVVVVVVCKCGCLRLSVTGCCCCCCCL